MRVARSGERGGVSRPILSTSGGLFRAVRPAFTLLEVLLASALAVILMAALYVALDVQLKLADAGREAIEQATVSRAIVHRFETDLSGCLGPVAPHSGRLRPARRPRRRNRRAGCDGGHGEHCDPVRLRSDRRVRDGESGADPVRLQGGRAERGGPTVTPGRRPPGHLLDDGQGWPARRFLGDERAAPALTDLYLEDGGSRTASRSPRKSRRCSSRTGTVELGPTPGTAGVRRWLRSADGDPVSF